MLKGLLFAFFDFFKNYIFTRTFFSRDLDFEKYAKPLMPSLSLDLGCGKTPKNPFKASKLYGIDLNYGVDNKSVMACDLGMESFPFDSNSFNYVTAFDLVEHIPKVCYVNGKRHEPFISLMNEVFRVLKPGGLFLSHTPAYPRLESFTDPTHVNTITVDTFKLYFSIPYLWAGRYGFSGKFEVVDQFWHRANLVTILKKPII